ncbi:MAG: metal-dependent hydrolase, partial [Weeksellaceae bacterium]|nr:metal-dependent hydrolase [Weeksellaceae bacterium]
MKITYYGHSALGIVTQNQHILVDPFISGNPKAASINTAELKADYILLTHAHYDHILDVEAIVERTGAKIISNHEVVTYYSNKGFEGHAMNQGGSWDFDFGRLKVVSAVHSSSFPDGSYGGNPVGFILESEGKTIYLSGDTALTMDMKLIPLFFQLDLAVFPIGGNYTMDVKEALVASDFVECNKILGVHYDTAPFIEINREEAIQN